MSSGCYHDGIRMFIMMVFHNLQHSHSASVVSLSNTPLRSLQRWTPVKPSKNNKTLGKRIAHLLVMKKLKFIAMSFEDWKRKLLCEKICNHYICSDFLQVNIFDLLNSFPNKVMSDVNVFDWWMSFWTSSNINTSFVIFTNRSWIWLLKSKFL